MEHDDNSAEPRQTLASLIARNRTLPLGRYLRDLARVSAMASAIAAAGCSGGDSEANPGDAGVDASRGDGGSDGGGGDGGSEAPPWIDPAEAIMPICEAGWRPTRGLTPAVEYDYLGVYVCSEGLDDSGYLIDTDGEPCEGATDPDRCEMLIEDQYGCPALHIRSGDDFELVETGEQLMRFLGTVDTAQEALLVAFLHGNTVRCGDAALGSARRVGDGFELIVTRLTAICDPIEYSRLLLAVTRDGTVTELRSEVYESTPGVCIGRSPEGLHTALCPSRSVAGKHFARIATLEAAAVIAFRRLADELARLGAPASLVDDVRKAADDEVRHADVMGAVARHFGAEPGAPRVESAAPRDALAIALENAVEGTIRETFGALTGAYQALAAPDPLVADAMREVSEDEIFHAELSERIDAFLDTLLTDSERHSVAEAKRQAITELRLETSIEPEDEIAALAGLPPKELALQWLDQLDRDIWTA